MKSAIYLEHEKMKVKLLLWREMYGGVRGTDVGYTGLKSTGCQHRVDRYRVE